MFAVLYQFSLTQDQEKTFIDCWELITDYFITNCGALGSCLHKGKDGLWVAYSRWPDRSTRDASWSSEGSPSKDFPMNIQEAIVAMQKLKNENNGLKQYEEICLEVVSDKLI